MRSDRPLPPTRSDAARAASRSNGARSRGPKSKAGKAISARNAVKHGLRARQPLRPGELPEWLKVIEARLILNAPQATQFRREQLDKFLSAMMRIDAADRAITDELARIHAALGLGPDRADAAPDLGALACPPCAS